MNVQHLVNLLKAARTARPWIKGFENTLASSLSCDSRSHDEDRKPRRDINALLNALEECDKHEVPQATTPPPTHTAPPTTLPFSPVDCHALVDALDDLLPHHALACCAHTDSGEWINCADGMVVISLESCKCSQDMKRRRILLHRFRPTSDKAFRVQ